MLRQTFEQKKSNDMGLFMRYIINFILLFLLIFAGIEAASAENSLPFQRALYVNEWYNTFGSKENIDIVIDNAIYMNCDAIFMYVGSEYYEAVRDPVNKGSWDSRAPWNMLEYAINKAHSENIQLHVWMPINIINSPIRAEYRLFGTEYNQAYRNGAVHNSRIDHAFIPAQDYAVGLAGFIAGHYPNLDGIHYEEPYYTSRSYSTAMRDRVKAKYGYDPLTKPEADMIPIIDDVARDVYIELFTKVRASINANKANPNLLVSANAADGYRPLHGFDPRYMSDNHLLDFYAGQLYGLTLGGFKYSINKLKTEVDDIPIIPISYITYSKIYPDSNPAFFDQIMKTCEYGGNAEAVFSYPWRNKVVEGKTVYEGLHNLPPYSSGGPSTIVSTPTLSLHSGTYLNSQSISISTSTTGATIRYTEDGTTPTETSSIYSTPVVISSTTTLIARAWKTGLTPSGIATAEYTIGTQAPAPAPAPVQTSIENPGFESGTTSWKFYTNGAGTFTTVSPGYEGSNTARLALSSGGSNIQLYQTGITMEPNTRYQLSFAAYSTTGHDVTARLLKHVSPYTAYAPDFTANLSTSWQTFTTEFTSSGIKGTVNDGRLQFKLAPFAKSGDNYYIDDVRLEKVSALELPVISTHPADQTVATGQTATFSVVATGTAPLTYQWQKNSMNIPGATDPSYTTPVTILADIGSKFRVQVTNPAGSIMSNAATCTVGTQAPILSSIGNPGFESGTTSWLFYTNGTGIFSTASPGYEGSNTAQLALSSSGSNIQLYQEGITLEPNTLYRLSFAAYSTTGHDVTVRLFKHVSPYTNYGLGFTANLGTNWQTFTTEFTTSGFTSTVNDGRLKFWLAPFAASGDNYYIDNVQLEKI